MHDGYEVYNPSDSLAFILLPDKTLVQTGLQTFIIRYDHHNYRRQLNRLRDMIRRGEITRLDELVSYCNFRYGNNRRSQMYGLELRPTKPYRYVKNV